MSALTVSNLLVGFQQSAPSGEGNDAVAPVSFQDVMTAASVADQPTHLRQPLSVVDIGTTAEQVVDGAEAPVIELAPTDTNPEALAQPLIAAAIFSIPDTNSQVSESVAAVDVSPATDVLVPPSDDELVRLVANDLVPPATNDLVAASTEVLVPQKERQSTDGPDSHQTPIELMLPAADTQQPDETRLMTSEGESVTRKESGEGSSTSPVLTTPVTSQAENEPALAPRPMPAEVADSSPQRVNERAEVNPVEAVFQDEPTPQPSQPEIVSDGETDAPHDRPALERQSTIELPPTEVQGVKEPGNTVPKPGVEPIISSPKETVAETGPPEIVLASRGNVTARGRDVSDAPQPSEETQQIMAAMKEAVEFSDGRSVRPVSLDLQPEEAGRLSIQMEPEAETVATQAVTAESASDDELVDQQKTLVDTSADPSSQNASLETSHQNDKQPGNQQQSHPKSQPPPEQANSVFTPNDTRIDAGVNPAAQKPDSVMVDASGKAIQQTGESITGTRPAEVTRQVVTAMKEVVNLIDGSSTRTVSLELHPQELGHLKIHIEQTAEAIATQIIASELISSDLLTNQKDALLEALADLGFESTSVDISHDERPQSSPQQDSSKQRLGKSFAQNDSDSTGQRMSVPTSNGLNIVV